MAGAPRPCVVVFARSPVPGRCKTRLIPALGRVGAARLHRRLVLRTMAAARDSGVALELWCTPDTNHPLFLACRRDFGARLRRQPRGDLGPRMARALAAVLAGGAPAAVLTGTDCPTLSTGDIRRAFDALANGADCTLQPSQDGGYVMIGARRLECRALAGIAWSSGRELAQTRRRVRRLGLSLSEGPTQFDVDLPADYRRARRLGLL